MVYIGQKYVFGVVGFFGFVGVFFKCLVLYGQFGVYDLNMFKVVFDYIVDLDQYSGLKQYDYGMKFYLVDIVLIWKYCCWQQIQ